MATSFDPALSTARDWLRLQLGDTNVNVVKATGADVMTLPVDDAVYDGVLTRYDGDERLSVLDLAEALIAKYAQLPNQAQITAVESAEWRNRLDAWKALATRVRAEIAKEDAAVVATSVTPPRSVAITNTPVW